MMKIVLKEKLTICILGDRGSIHIVRWANALFERGHAVHILSMNVDGDPLTEGVIVHKLPIQSKLGYILNVFSVKKKLKKIKPDILHSHYASGYGTLGTLSGFENRILSVWGADVYNFPYESKWKEILLRQNLNTAKLICSTSHVMAEKTKKFLDFPRKIKVTPFGVDCSIFFPQKKHTTKEIFIGTVKSLEDKYGINYLINGFEKAFRNLRRSHPELAKKLRLLIVGGGSREGELKEQTMELGIAEVVIFTGKVPYSDVPKYLSKLDIYVAMSVEDGESFGVAIVEASACGVPVIVSNVGGLPEVVEAGVSGYVVENRNEMALSNRIIDLVLDSEKRKLMGKAGEERVKDIYEWEKCVDMMEETYIAHLVKGVNK